MKHLLYLVTLLVVTPTYAMNNTQVTTVHIQRTANAITFRPFNGLKTVEISCPERKVVWGDSSIIKILPNKGSIEFLYSPAQIKVFNKQTAANQLAPKVLQMYCEGENVKVAAGEGLKIIED